MRQPTELRRLSGLGGDPAWEHAEADRPSRWVGISGGRTRRPGTWWPRRRVRPVETFRLEVDELAEAELALGVDHHDPHEGRARRDAGMDLRPGNDVVHAGSLASVFDSCLSRRWNTFGYHVGRPPAAPEPLR